MDKEIVINDIIENFDPEMVENFNDFMIMAEEFKNSSEVIEG